MQPLPSARVRSLLRNALPALTRTCASRSAACCAGWASSACGVRVRLPAGAGGGACGAPLAPVIACWAPAIAAVLTGARRAADATGTPAAWGGMGVGRLGPPNGLASVRRRMLAAPSPALTHAAAPRAQCGPPYLYMHRVVLEQGGRGRAGSPGTARRAAGAAAGDGGRGAAGRGRGRGGGRRRGRARRVAGGTRRPG